MCIDAIEVTLVFGPRPSVLGPALSRSSPICFMQSEISTDLLVFFTICAQESTGVATARAKEFCSLVSARSLSSSLFPGGFWFPLPYSML